MNYKKLLIFGIVILSFISFVFSGITFDETILLSSGTSNTTINFTDMSITVDLVNLEDTYISMDNITYNNSFFYFELDNYNHSIPNDVLFSTDFPLTTTATGEFVTYAITLESNDIKFYENGELKASGTISTELFDWDLTTTIGKNSDSLNAEIKWLMTFNQTLSEGQIQTLHQSYISSQNEVYVSATGGTLYGDYNFTSPNGQLWQCGPDNSGTWTCS